MNRETQKKTTGIMIHILVWAVLLALPIYSAKRFSMGSNFLLTYYAFITINALIFYANYLVLVPGLFFQKKRYRYYIAALALVSCFYFISDFANEKVFSYISRNGNPEQFSRPQNKVRRLRPLRPPLPRFFIAIPKAHLIGYMSSSFFMVFVSLGLRVFERQSKIEKMQENIEKTKLSTELAFLKNQISPHFFFNTLNNIYALIDRSNEDSKNAVIKLSRLMRYVLNESGQDNRPLSDEIEFMNNYIDLMKLRISSKTKINVSFPADFRNLMIPHLLFISLIENAFKYGISVREESFVNISLACGEHYILFKCENGMPESNTGKIFVSSGIGLENLKKRLGLIYPGRHELEINSTAGRFEVTLNILLK